MSDPVPPGLLDIAGHLMPGADLAAATLVAGGSHDVVLLPGIAAVRIARHEVAAAKLSDRVALLRRLAAAGLPFQIPEPLTDVVRHDGRTAVALSWLPGTGHPKGAGEPAALAALLTALAEVDCAALGGVLGGPHEYAGGPRWAEIMIEEVAPRLPRHWREEVRRRVRAAEALEPVPLSLVHGDLAGDNVHWDQDGRLIGVLDWDLASEFDPAVDAACLAWHGWHNLRRAVDAVTYRRAATWYLTFGIEQPAAALINGEPAEVVDRCVDVAVSFLERTVDGQPDR